MLLLAGVVVTSSLLAFRQYQANLEATRYNDDLLRKQNEKDAALKAALSASARLALDRGIMLCEQGDVPRGMLTFARSASIAVEAGDADLESAARFNMAAWEREMWRLQAIMPMPEGTLAWKAVLHPRNPLMAVALANKTAQLWSVAANGERQILHTLPHDGVVVDLQFNSDGNLLLTRTEQSVRLWNVSDGTPACPPIAPGPKILAAVLSPDATFVVTGADDKTARFWNAKTGVQEGAPLPHKFAVSVVALDATGRRLLTSSGGTVQVFDTASRASFGRELTHTSLVRSAKFSPDGHRVLTGTLGKTAHVWSVNDQTEVYPALEFDDPVEEVLFNPDGDVIAVRTMTGSAHLRQARSGAPIGGAVPHPGIVYHLEFGGRGNRLLTAGNNGIVRVWDLTPDGLVAAVLHHPNQNRLLSGSCSFGADGQSVVTVDGTVRLWRAPKGQRRRAPIQHAGGAYAVAFSNDAKFALTGGNDGLAVLRSLTRDDDTDRILSTGASFPPPIAAVTFSPNGEFAVTADFNGVIRLWDVRTGLVVKVIEGPPGLNMAAFGPDNETIITGGADRTARFWNSKTGQPAGRPLLHEGPVNAVAFSRDGRFAFTADDRGGVRLWDVATGAVLNSRWCRATDVKAIATSSDGRFVMTGSGDKAAGIWDAATGRAVGTPFAHQDVVRDVAFGSDGLTVLTGSYDRTARRWHAATGIPVGPVLKHRGRVRSVAVSADGRTVATASWDGTATLWVTPAALEGSPDRLTERIQLATGIDLDEHFAARTLAAHAWLQLRERSTRPISMRSR
jgi:WD40 repeat protein